MDLENKTKKYEIDMCEGPILKKILIYAIPLMLSSILQLLFNAADIVVVGRFAGADSLAAVGSTAVLNRWLVNLFIGFSVGTSILVSTYYGAKDEKNIEETVHTSILMAVIVGLFLAVIGCIFTRPLLIRMGSPEDVIHLSTVYMRIIFLGMPAFMVFNYGSAVLRAIGDTKRPLYDLTAAGIINVLLNLIFVIRFQMHVVGVAAATIIAQYISAGMLLKCMCSLEGSCQLKLKKMHMNKDKIVKIIRYGLPAGFQNVIFDTSNVLIQSSINSFGSVAMAGVSAAANIEGFSFAALNSFHHAAVGFTSQNFGRKRYHRIPKILKCCIICSVSLGILVGILCYFFGDKLIGIYSTESEVISYGLIRLYWLCIPYALFGIQDVMLGMQRGLGYAMVPTLVSLFGACGFRILWILTVFEKWHSLPVLFASYPISWALTGMLHMICFYFIWKKVTVQQMKIQG